MQTQLLNYRSLNDLQKNFIKKKGMEVFASIKNYVEPETGRNINHWLKKYNLEVSVPSEKFIKQNISDISFAIIKLPISNSIKSSLSTIRAYLEDQLENPENKKVLLFHEIKGENEQEWSLVNMFDNNIMLWLKLINEKLVQEDSPLKLEKDDVKSVDELLSLYFGEGDTKSFAAHDLLLAMIESRHRIFKDVFSKTWTVGKEIEEKFINYLSSLGASDSDIKKFSGEGNFVDRAGIDCAIKGISNLLNKKVSEDWIPVQVKPNQQDAFKTIPYKGISVYPYNGEFYFYESKEVPPKKIDDLFLKNE